MPQHIYHYFLPQVIYRLTAGSELEMDFRAESDQPTPVALTNHAYWNLSGDLQRPVHDHTLRVAASRYLALGAHQVGKWVGRAGGRAGAFCSGAGWWDGTAKQRIGDR